MGREAKTDAAGVQAVVNRRAQTGMCNSMQDQGVGAGRRGRMLQWGQEVLRTNLCMRLQCTVGISKIKFSGKERQGRVRTRVAQVSCRWGSIPLTK